MDWTASALIPAEIRLPWAMRALSPQLEDAQLYLLIDRATASSTNEKD
jgi:hypothetical protein